MVPFVNIHTHKLRHTGIELTSNGIPPWDAATATQAQFEELKDSEPAYIGEIGLDYIRGKDRQLQEQWLVRQADLAQALGVPVIIHCVRAYADLIRILAPYTIPKIIHGFTGHPQLAASLTDKGYYLSFGPGITRSPKTQEALRTIPRSRIMLETDDSDSTIEEVYAAAAVIMGITLDDLKETVYRNYMAVFNDKTPQKTFAAYQ